MKRGIHYHQLQPSAGTAVDDFGTREDIEAAVSSMSAKIHATLARLGINFSLTLEERQSGGLSVELTTKEARTIRKALKEEGVFEIVTVGKKGSGQYVIRPKQADEQIAKHDGNGGRAARRAARKAKRKKRHLERTNPELTPVDPA